MVFKCMFCGNKADSLRNLTLHKFPSDEESSKKWLEQMGMPNLEITNSMRLCSQHFVASALKRNKSYMTLENDAVPTIFNKLYKNCCVYCKTKKEGSNRLFHRFPLHDATLTAQWLKNMDIKEFYPTPYSLLCSSHFEDSCYRRNTGRNGLRIKVKAIPTIFSNVSSSSFAEPQMQKRNTSDMSQHELSKLQEIVQDADVTCESAMDFSATEIDNDRMNDNPYTSLGDPTVSITPKTAWQIVARDHMYTSSPRFNRKSLDRVKKKLAPARSQTEMNKKIKRLQKKIVSLQDIVKELRRRKSISKSGLASLESIADLNVRNLLQKYLKQVTYHRFYLRLPEK